MTIEDRLTAIRLLVGLRSYRPRNRKAKRRFRDQRRRIVQKLRRAA
jgi:hypothetical protein